MSYPPSVRALLDKPHRRGGRGHASPLYGLLYPPNLVRILNLAGDPLDATRAILVFDRDLRATTIPSEVDLWLAGHRAFTPELINPRAVRVSVGTPLWNQMAWEFRPDFGSFTGADGSGAAIESSGSLLDVSGAFPAGKLFLSGAAWVGEQTVDFTFSQPVTLVESGDYSGFLVRDESGVWLQGNGAAAENAQTIRVSFAGVVPAEGMTVGLSAEFAGVAEAGDVLKPVEWKI
ncbi:MAG TPA: hypothetical protein VK986_27075 [Tepidisphaeraceae bacterium]|nr:hypothetical protein [Tepidisphaeraceae bacterium]